ncbi:glycosyltransferase, partial [Patescibacteria group bacterium]|nr:glycosyltransferase [Patescibacteria group bacterium]
KSGKPVIASDIGEIGVFVKNNLNGFLVAPKDSNGLAEKIALLLSDQSLREQFGNAAAETVKPYSMKNYMKNFEDLILNILSMS